MIALDTNVLARYLLRDDEAQFKAALALLGDGRVYTAPATVLLELVWVLRSQGCEPGEIAAALESLIGLPNFQLRNTEAVVRALAWSKAGMDFADALHLALSGDDESFVTFDKGLRKSASKARARPEVALP